MKRTKAIILAACLLYSGAVMASGNLKVNISADEKNLEVNISNVVESQYEIEITNSRGDILYYKYTKNPSKVYANTYDLSALSNGRYKYTVRLGDETETAYLEVKRGKAEVIDQRKDLQPYFAMDGKRLNISFLNFEREKILLLVYDNKTQQVLYRKGFDRDFSIQHALNFSKLDKGSYEAILATQNENYSYEVNVK